MKKTMLFMVIISLIFAGCNQNTDPGPNGPGEPDNGFKTITAAAARQIMADMRDNGTDFVILDVRSYSEYRDIRIPGALLLPVGDIHTEAATVLPNKDKVILVYCAAGVRSRRAAGYLAEMYYTNVYDFGGINAWIAAGYETVSGHLPPVEMVRIKAGTFLMGSPSTETGRESNEGPQRWVKLTDDFYMGRFLVTQAQWEAVMGSNPSFPGGGISPNFPVNMVSWYQALVFANRLSKKAGLTPAFEMELNVIGSGDWSTDTTRWGAIPTGNNGRWNQVRIVPGSTGYRFPTEAQWEFAARGGTTTPFSDGNAVWNEASIDPLGWFNFNSLVDGNPQLNEVGSKKANPFGLYDIHGSVWELMWDRWGSYPILAEGTIDYNPTGPTTGNNRIARGGCYICFLSRARSAARQSHAPAFMAGNFGLRLSRPAVD